MVTIQVGDFVWHNDFSHIVLEIRGKRARIREVSSVAESPEFDEWVAINQLEIDLSDDDDE